MNKINKYFISALSVILFGEIYFYLFDSSLRISAGIIILNLIILIIDDISEYSFCVFLGISVFIIRSVVGIYINSLELQSIIEYNLPSAIYYFTYGLLALLFSLRDKKENFVKGIMLLSLIDFISNTVEAILREKIINFNIIKMILIIAIGRSILAYLIYILYKNQELFIQKREHQKRYSQLNILISSIQAEMFYLRKSMRDIESVMSKSYKLYNSYKDNFELSQATLEIAKDVHEIKKDYDRVLKGFESFLDNFEETEIMTIGQILAIIKENTIHYIKKHNKNLKIHFDFQDKLFGIKKYYYIFTILNNLIINSIEACNENGIINISQYSDENNIYFRVEDNGLGIYEDIIPYIFNPGFTTKCNDSTGLTSTGIGLSHVKNIIENLNGNICVESQIEEYTIFIASIPKYTILG